MAYNGIILSGLPVSGKSTIANSLSKIYEWPIHSIGRLWREEHKKLYPKCEVSFEEYWGNTSLEDNLRMNLKAREIFAKGNIIGDTRYSIYCQDLPLLLVFVYADLDVRVKRGLESGKYKGKSLEDIKNIIKKRENDEVEMGKRLYGKDYDYIDPKHYHLILNSGMLTIEEEMLTIEQLIKDDSEEYF